MCGASCDETATDLSCSIELTARECPGVSDRITRPRVGRRLQLEYPEDSFGAVRRPRCHEPAIDLAQRLW